MQHTPHPRTPISALAIAAAGLVVLATGSLAADASPGPSSSVPSSCWTETPGSVGRIDHPTDLTAIVLRLSVGGGFVPQDVAFLELPTFTLYGNDVVIFRPGDAWEDLADPMAPFACVRLTPDQVDELLADALDEGGLRTAVPDYPDPYITDTPFTTFTIAADGVEKTVVIAALGFDTDAPDQDARAMFDALADRLASFEDEAPGAVPFDVPAYEARLTAAWPELEGEAASWPWSESPGQLFGREWDQVATLSPGQVAEIAPVPNGGQTFILVETPEGERAYLTIRPVLPTAA